MPDQPKQSLLWQSLSKRARFGLRTLLAVVTVLALALGWLVQRVERQRAAVEAIERSGGRVVFAHQYAHEQGLLKAGTLSRTSAEAPPPGHPWLRRWLSPHYFQRAENVYLQPEAAGSAKGWPLRDLPGAKRLLLNRGRVIAVQLWSIGKARSLEELYLIDTELDWLAIPYLTKLRKLKRIDIELGYLSGSAFQELARIPKVEELSLMNVRIDPEGFAALPSFQKLRFLDVLHIEMRDEHVDYIAKMPSLKYVQLLGTAITAERIERLRRERPDIEVVFLESETAAEPNDE